MKPSFGLLLASAAAAATAGLAGAQLSVETGRFYPGYITGAAEAPDVSRLAKVAASGSGATMCAVPSVGASTTVYYGPCLASVDYAGQQQAPPLGYVKQSVEGLMLIKNGATAYLASSTGGGTGTAIATGSGAAHTTAAPVPGRTTGLHLAPMVSGAAGAGAGAFTQAPTVSAGRRRGGPAVCNNGSDYVYASGTQSVGNATVGLALMGVAAEVGPAGGDAGAACTEDLQAAVGEATYLVLDGEFESEWNKFPIVSAGEVVDVRIAAPGVPRAFDAGTYKFSFYGGFYGSDWDSLAGEGYSHVVLRLRLQQLGCDASNGCDWGLAVVHGDAGEEADFPPNTTTTGGGGGSGSIADVRSFSLQANRGGVSLRSRFQFDRTYRFGNITHDGTGSNLVAHDEGEGDVTVNIVAAGGDGGDGDDGRAFFVDFVVPFDELAETGSYFVYDPTVSAEDASPTTTAAPMAELTTAAATADGSGSSTDGSSSSSTDGSIFSSSADGGSSSTDVGSADTTGAMQTTSLVGVDDTTGGSGNNDVTTGAGVATTACPPGLLCGVGNAALSVAAAAGACLLNAAFGRQ